MIKYFCDKCDDEVTVEWYNQHSNDPYLWCSDCLDEVNTNLPLIEAEFVEEKQKLADWYGDEKVDLYTEDKYKFKEYKNNN